MSEYFRSHYDVVLIGASLATLSTAITLAEKGFSVLALEQHSVPGGVATSFVRGGVEFEASLHEMICIGREDNPMIVRRFLEEHDIHVDWIRLPHAFRLVTPEYSFELHAGENGDFSVPAKEIATLCEDKDGSVYKRLMDFFTLCNEVHDASDLYSLGKLSNVELFRKHGSFIYSAGYTVTEIFEHFDLPQKARDVLSAYWIYLGSPVEHLPFTVYGYLLADYLGHGAYIPRNTSYEIAMRMADAAEKRGVQIEYGQHVERILIENGRVSGVRLANGETISSDYVVCGAYPHTAFTRMVEPSALPKKARQWMNSLEVSVSCFSLVMLLDASAEELGIKDYATFYASKGMDTLASYNAGKEDASWDFITSVCVNKGHEDASPKGTCIYSITYLPQQSSFDAIDPEQYEEYKNRHAQEFLDMESKRLGVDLRSHILEMVVETPLTIAHYTGAYGGAIYGYRHRMDNHVIGRSFEGNGKPLIPGLSFSGAHQMGGDGMGPAIVNGQTSAKEILAQAKRRKR